jgi:fructose 1,6-bisphosphatase
MITISVIKADIGGYVGHSSMHPDIVETGREEMEYTTMPAVAAKLADRWQPLD